eukprot:13109119-Ditylum_brightwellii.AAC.1
MMVGVVVVHIGIDQDDNSVYNYDQEYDLGNCNSHDNQRCLDNKHLPSFPHWVDTSEKYPWA